MKKQFSKKYKHKKEILHVLGSFRKSKKNIMCSKGLSCLVLPEGLMDESILMFDFSLKCANHYPEIQFIWRLHPIIGRKNFVDANPIFKSLPSNITFSTNKFDFDIKQSKVAIYRGSTAIIEAASKGLYPIYLSLGEEISIDPLYSISEGKYIASCPDDIPKIIKFGKKTPKLIKYCEQFYDDYDSKFFKNFLFEKKVLY